MNAVTAVILWGLLVDPLTELQRFPPREVITERWRRAEAEVWKKEELVDSLWWRHWPLELEKEVRLQWRDAKVVEAIYYSLYLAHHYVSPPQDNYHPVWRWKAQHKLLELRLWIGSEDFSKGLLPQPEPPYYP